LRFDDGLGVNEREREKGEVGGDWGGEREPFLSYFVLFSPSMDWMMSTYLPTLVRVHLLNPI
jgi:hypothetical protein